jgi:molecular chaperone DnaJ
MEYYSILEIEETATDEEVKKAYRKMARRYHPDLNPDADEEQFKKISLAYEVLSDPQKRAMVDQGIDPMDSSQGFGQGGASPFDIFNDFFGQSAGFAESAGFGGRQRRKPTRTRPGNDFLVGASISLKDSVFGSTYKQKIDINILCKECKGGGGANGEKPITCEQCQGTGIRRVTQNTILGQMVSEVACQNCRGFGDYFKQPCPKCFGEGRVKENKEITIKIPAGVKNGARLRLQNQGEVGPNGGTQGDLYFEIQVQPDDTFQRQGNDLIAEISIPLTTAIIGGTIKIETFDGEVDAEIPAGTNFEDILTIPNLGSYVPGSDNRGSLKLVANIKQPKELSKEQLKIVEQLDKTLSAEEKQGHLIKTKSSKSFFDKVKDMFK